MIRAISTFAFLAMLSSASAESLTLSPGLPPEKWSSLMYGLWPDGGLKDAKEETYG